MKATGRNRLITIERYTATQDATGQEIESWSTLSTAWAAKSDISDGERLAAAEIASSITTRFLLLWSEAYATVDSKDRVTLDGRTYDIFSVKEIGRREGIEITAAARSDG